MVYLAHVAYTIYWQGILCDYNLTCLTFKHKRTLKGYTLHDVM